MTSKKTAVKTEKVDKPSRDSFRAAIRNLAPGKHLVIKEPVSVREMETDKSACTRVAKSLRTRHNRSVHDARAETGKTYSTSTMVTYDEKIDGFCVTYKIMCK